MSNRIQLINIHISVILPTMFKKNVFRKMRNFNKNVKLIFIILLFCYTTILYKFLKNTLIN